MKINEESFKKFGRRLKHYIRELMGEDNEANQFFMDLMKKELKRELIENNNVHTGALVDSITVKYDTHLEGFVLLMDEHWKYIEYGTSPHSPPINERVVSWVRDKYIPYIRGNKKLEQAVYLFIQHVRQYGTQPYPFVRRALLRAKKKFLQEFGTKIKGKVHIREL